jgi:imidazolonepropionase-like amidohydrolase/Tol biopolymer transport system component
MKATKVKKKTLFHTFAICVSLIVASHVLAQAPVASDAPTDVSKEPSKKKWDVNNPPGEKATVNIDTKTGTWMTVDVSPDGKQIVFDLLGDLYLLPIAGGEAKPLTSSIAWEMQAKFSPDGKRIAYMSDAGGGDNIWVMNSDGTNAKEVTKESVRLLNNPVWHPNGQYIAARKHFVGTRSLGSGEIWMYHVSGTDKQQEGVQLNEKPNWQKDLGEPAFSPDGRYVYYSQDTTPGTTFEYNKNSNGQIYQIFRRDMRTGKAIAFVSGAGGAIRPVPSPDGQYLAFVRRVRVNEKSQSTLFLKDLKTGEEVAVWGELERDMQEAWAVHGVYPSFAWMPSTTKSTEIVVWAKGKIWRVDPFKKIASEIPFHVKHSREIRRAIRYPINVGVEKWDVQQLRWVNVAPDGSRVVYSALGQLYVKTLPNGTPQRLTKQTTHFEFFPRFSRDGQRVVFTTWNDQQLGSVRTIDLKSGKETVVTGDPGQYIEPTFSADGKLIAYVKSRGGYLTSSWYSVDTGVHVTAADGKGEPKLITEDGRSPQFGANETADSLYVSRIAFTNEVDWTTSLVRFKLDKSEEQTIVRSEMATDFALSPDGAWLAYRERYQTHVMPLPNTGRPFVVGRKSTALPVKTLSVNAGDYLHWSGDSRTVHFSLGNELFSRQLKDTFSFVDDAESAESVESVKAPLPKISENGMKIGFTEAVNIPRTTTVISGAKIITMKGDEIINNGRIVIKDNRIVAIGRTQDIAVPTGATMIDASGKSIIPGLVDVHWHGGMSAQGIIPQQSWINYASLAFGVTTIHDPSNDTASIFTVAEMQRTGRVVGPRVFSTGTILYGAKGTFASEVNSLDDALTHLKRMKAAGANTVKSYNQPRRDQRQQVLEAARQTGMMVVPEGGSLFQHNMNMIIDGHTGVEHAIPVAHAYDDVKQLWSQTQVGYTPTLNVAYGGLDGEHYWYAKSDVWRHPILSKYVPRGILEPRAVRRPIAPDADYNVITVAKTATELQRVGVNVNIGAHGQREGLGSHWDIWMLAKGGMTSLEAIRAATLNGAKYLGMERDIGSLEIGKLADLIIIDADVINDIEKTDRITHVIQNGRVYDVATMNEIGATPNKRKPFYFERGTAGSEAFDRLHAMGLMHGNDHSQCNH